MTEDKFDFAFVRVKFKEIRPDNLNPRHHRDPEADLTLRRLIDTHGTIDIMWICKGENDHFRLLDGHRRYDILVEDEYLEQNPTITCALLLAKDNPDRLLTEEEITLWRILRERGKEKWKDFDFYLKAVEHADSQKEKGRKYFQIAREDFDWNPERLSRIKSVIEDPILSDFLSHGAISMHEAVGLINIPAETQKDLIERRDDLSACELRETVKLVREGMEIASAVESVKEAKKDIPEPSEKEGNREAVINIIREDLREQFTKDTKDLNLHDIRRIIKLIETGVVMHDAIRTVKLSETETPQEEVQDGELPVNEGEGETTENSGEPLQPPSPETTGIVAQTLGIKEKGIEEAVLDESITSPDAKLDPQSPLPEEEVEVTPDVDSSPETKPDPSELAVCKAFRTVKSTLQKYAKKPAKMINGQFKTDAQRNEVVSSLKDIETHARTVRLNIESENNGRSHSCGSIVDLVSRVKEAEGHSYSLLPKEVETAESNLNEGIAVLNRMKETIAKRGS